MKKTSALCWTHIAPGAFGLSDGPPLSIPYLVTDPQPGEQLHVDRTPLTLVRGILLTTSTSRVLLGTLPSNEQFLAVLEFARPALKDASLDELCVNAAAGLRQEWSTDHAIRALTCC